jgi:hypothetical protein
MRSLVISSLASVLARCWARHLDLADPRAVPPCHELVYEPFYDDLPIVEEEDVLYQPF